MTRRRGEVLFLLFLFTVTSAMTQDIRSRTRPTPQNTEVSESQAVELTLTLNPVTVRPVQTWVRTAGTLDRTGRILTASLAPPDSSLIMLSAPFALIGGIALQWRQGYPMTTAVIIGYISLFAVAIQTGIIMIEFIREALRNRTESQSYEDAVMEGAVARLRPKLMTVATTVLGLLPIMLATGSGMDITQPIATPTFGGMISSTIYVLFLIPCLFVIGADIRRSWLAALLSGRRMH